MTPKELAKSTLLKFGIKMRKKWNYTQTDWSERLSEEVSFWDDFLKTKGGLWPADFRTRMNPESRLQPVFVDWLDPAQTAYKILDVGAGPMTAINKVYPGKRVDLSAVDPLADEYNKLLTKYAIQPIIRTEACAGEAVSEKYGSDIFDIVYSRNALDHSFDPLRCIASMIKTAKKTGCIILQVKSNEGWLANWGGLHQWDFFIRNFFGRSWLCVKGPSGRTVNITDYFGRQWRQVLLRRDTETCRYDSLDQFDPRMITAVFRKN